MGRMKGGVGLSDPTVDIQTDKCRYLIGVHSDINPEIHMHTSEYGMRERETGGSIAIYESIYLAQAK